MSRLTAAISLALLVPVGIAAAKVALVNSFAAAPARGLEVWGYDSRNGTDQASILQHFNLHRGRWWNYYERGSWLLAHGHYGAAERDFRAVIDRRPADTRDARTYGMHFKDCFGHRELGITLYHRAMQGGDGDIGLLQQARDHLHMSLRQTRSARAEFFRTLVEKSRWSEGDDRDTTAPEITVENAAAAGDNWAVVCSNRQVVRLDLRVTDSQSGVGAIWIDEQDLLIDHSGREVRQTVYIPIDPGNPLIRLRAADLLGNGDSRRTVVKVELDTTPPTILATSDAAQATSDGLVSVICSARDDLGLAAVHVNNERIACGRRRECRVRVRVPSEPGQARVRLQAIDVAGNTTTGYVDIASEGDRILRSARADSPWAGPASFQDLAGAIRVRPGVFAGFPTDGIFSFATRRAVVDEQEVHVGAALNCRLASRIGPGGMLPLLEFANYLSQPGGFRVATAEYVINGTLKHGAGIRWISVDEKIIELGSCDDSDAVQHFSSPIRLPSYGQKRVKVKALTANGSQVGEVRELVLQRVRDVTQDQDALYSVIALPPVPDGIGNSLCPVDLYASMRNAVVACPLDDSDPGSPPRFNCIVMKQMDPGITRVEPGDPVSRAVPLGRNRGVDLSICGYIRRYDQRWEITVYLIDNETGAKICSAVDRYIPNDQSRWPAYMNSLVKELKGAIPRVPGKVTGLDSLSKKIHFDVGEEGRLFSGQKLCVFERETETLQVAGRNRLAEATVLVCGKQGQSEAKVAPANRRGYPLGAFRKSQLVVVTK